MALKVATLARCVGELARRAACWSRLAQSSTDVSRAGRARGACSCSSADAYEDERQQAGRRDGSARQQRGAVRGVARGASGA
jgi:hypothetical protein